MTTSAAGANGSAGQCAVGLLCTVLYPHFWSLYHSGRKLNEMLMNVQHLNTEKGCTPNSHKDPRIISTYIHCALGTIYDLVALFANVPRDCHKWGIRSSGGFRGGRAGSPPAPAPWGRRTDAVTVLD